MAGCTEIGIVSQQKEKGVEGSEKSKRRGSESIPCDVVALLHR
jgi:hypothetical protein